MIFRTFIWSYRPLSNLGEIYTNRVKCLVYQHFRISPKKSRLLPFLHTRTFNVLRIYNANLRDFTPA